MSPTLKSKTKSSSRMVKEQQKTSSVSSPALVSSPAPSNGGNVPTSASSSCSGTSHATEKTRPPTLTGRLLTVVEIEEQTQNSAGNGSECDSLSNNGSCSGESEDPKEKAPTGVSLQSEAIPGRDIDKRDKLRQKNERKHQRQKERRSQELHERCTNILMSWKLDLLTQHFVAMGFQAEKATRAIILNEGRVEDSVSWLCEGGAEEKLPASNKDATNLKIDISDELAKLAEMELKYKCTKQEVQRAVVSCEGDLDKAVETLKMQQKHEAPSTPPRVVESGGSVPSVSGLNKVAQPLQDAVTALQGKPTASGAVQQLRREESDLNYTKTAMAGPSMSDQRNVASQPSSKVQSKADWVKNQGSSQIDKRWLNATPLFSYSLASSSLQAVAPPSKTETRHVVVGGEGSRLVLQQGSMREPIIVMQRPQSINAKPYQQSTVPSVSMPPPVTSGWESNRLSVSDALKIANGGMGQRYLNMNQSTSSVLNPNSQPFIHPDLSPHPFVSSPLEVDSTGWRGGSWGSGRPSGQPSSLATSSSLGIFTGWGSSSRSSGSSSPVDWSNSGLIQQSDYTRVDWSLDSTPLALTELQSQPSNKLYEAWLTQFDAPNSRNHGMFLRGSRSARIQDNSLLSMDPINAVLSPDWTSPFAGKDIFRVPRQIVTSPTP